VLLLLLLLVVLGAVWLTAVCDQLPEEVDGVICSKCKELAVQGCIYLPTWTGVVEALFDVC
jgi:hypothetical protein